MNRSRLGKAVFGAAVALSLAFGAREAFASTRPAETGRRPYCADDADCQATCDRLYPGQEKVGFCTDGHTCFCY